MLIAQISDMHVKPPGELLYKRIDTTGFLERAVAHVMALDPKPDVVLATGDLVDGGKPEEYALLRRLLAPLPMPVYLIPGNHDARDAMRQAFPDHTYLPKSGFLQYKIEDLPVRLIALDTLVPGKGHGALCDERLDAIVRRHSHVERVMCGHVHRPIQVLWAGTMGSIAPSTAHQATLDLHEGTPHSLIMEPPGLALHLWKPGVGLVT